MDQRLEAEFVTFSNGYVVLTGPNGQSFEVSLDKFRPADRRFIELLAKAPEEPKPLPAPKKTYESPRDYRVREADVLRGEFLEPASGEVLWVEGADDPLGGSWLHFTATDSALILPSVPPGRFQEKYLDRILVGDAPARPSTNLRLEAHADGTIVLPHPPDFPGLVGYAAASRSGTTQDFVSWQSYGDEEIESCGSFVLRRGYMATLAENPDGTGGSRNYVAQDHDVVISKLPKELGNGVRFIRVFPWRWTGKKGIAGGIHQPIDAKWFYNWNISDRSTPTTEYVAIRQNQHWPGLGQDWRQRGVNHLLGLNEPDKKDQANMSVDAAIQLWPHLQKTGLRLGSPSTSDGGLNWLYQFMERADREGLRVDFVAVHYYRAVPNPGDERSAAEQMRRFLEDIHKRTGRPLWVTEWNNGANWTGHPDPNPEQQAAAIKAMIEMMDEAPFVERYAPFNWVEACRELVRKDNSLTPAGEAYRDHRSPLAFTQPRSQR